jgi:hypothetical protein
MPISHLPSVLARLTAATMMTSVAVAETVDLPVPVSPGATIPGAVTEARCPTFSWAGVDGAAGYEIAVFRLGGDGELELAVRAAVPRNATAWTPPSDRCFERGARYAWSVAASGAGRNGSDPEHGLEWAPAALFEVASAPALDELERALATVERFLATREDAGGVGPRTGREARDRPSPQTSGDRRLVASRGVVDLVAPRPATVPERVSAAASAPTFGSASLSVSNQVHLAAASAIFKDGEVFLWDDADGNTALGREALSSVGGNATNNTALGRGALQATTSGPSPLQGSFNTVVGDQAGGLNTTGHSNSVLGAGAFAANTVGHTNVAIGRDALAANVDGNRNAALGASALAANTDGFWNTAAGHDALHNNTTGYENTGIGRAALRNNISGSYNTALGVYALRYTTGSRNIALGHSAGRFNTGGEDSIFIGSEGLNTDDATIRIGVEGTQNATYLAGIWGQKVDQDEQMPVLVDADGKLGTVLSSRRFKQDVEDLGPLVDGLLELRPVAFRYRDDAALNPDGPRQFGLIAEEVAEVFPELVVYDREGNPLSVKYHLLGSLLLGALQRQQELLEEHYRRLEAVESRPSRGRRRP